MGFGGFERALKHALRPIARTVGVRRSERGYAWGPVALTTRPEPRWRRLTGDVDLVRAEVGLLLVAARDTVISEGIRSSGVWAPEDVRLFRQLIGPGDHVVEVGANLGHHTVLFSGLAGPVGRVLAIEPQTLMFRLLNANLLLNGCANVAAECCAAGERAGVVKLWPIDYTAKSNYGLLGVSQHQGELVFGHDGEAVPIRRVDDLLAELRWPRVDFIKVDAQTYDLYVLRGAETTLRTWRPRVFVEVTPYYMRRTGYDYLEIYRFLERLDYIFFEPRRSLLEPAPVRVWSGDESEDWDVLAVPAERFAEDGPCAAAPSRRPVTDP